MSGEKWVLPVTKVRRESKPPLPPLQNPSGLKARPKGVAPRRSGVNFRERAASDRPRRRKPWLKRWQQRPELSTDY